MRTTIDLPADLHRTVATLAQNTQRNLSSTAVDLIRRGLVQLVNAPTTGPVVTVDPATGLPQVHLPMAITAEDVARLDDGH